MLQFEQQLWEYRKTSRKGVVCTVVDTSGSTPRKSGSKMLVGPEGWIAGSVGGGALEEQVIKDCQEVLRTGKSELKKHELVRDHGMCCGGSVVVYMEALNPPEFLFIFGAGHVGLALAEAARNVSFSVILADNRDSQVQRAEELAAAFDQIESRSLKTGKDLKSCIEDLGVSAASYVCVMTHDHALDRALIGELGDRKLAYLGMIGSARKIALAKKYFLETGLLSEAELDKIHQPIGLEIGAESPSEIAVAVLAQLIAVRSEQRESLVFTEQVRNMLNG